MKRASHSGSAVQRAQSWTLVRAVRSGLVNMIPVLIIGAFALIFKTFPVDAYQRAIASFADGFLIGLFDMVFSATFGVLSVYMTLSISRSYLRIKGGSDAPGYGASVASLLSFFLLAGTNLESFGTNSTGPKSMFLAIITGLGATALYLTFFRLLHRKRRLLFSAGATREFNRMLSTLFPITLTVLVFVLVNALVVRIFDVDSFRALLSRGSNALFAHIPTGFFKGFLFVFLSSLLWFCGIHGSDTLEGVMETWFTPALSINQTAVAAGGAATEVLTKEFFDCFVLMGGCGSTICLLIAILLFSRNRARRGLGLTAAFPMIFNINELMVFGLPIILNPTMLVPFLAVPLLCYTSSYIALSSGMVPLITSAVEWTTPIILGGYRATGSFAGSLLQLWNVVLGVLVYLPFVRLLDRQTADEAKRNYDEFMHNFRARELEMATTRLMEHSDVYGTFAKGLCAELRHGLDRYLKMGYQPQYHYDGHCVGVESLLRWEHPVHGLLYPPLVVKLAEEGGFLPALEEAVMARVLADRPALLERFGPDIIISFNVTGTTVVTPRFMQYCRQQNEKTPFRELRLCVEVTEQATLQFNDETRRALQELRGMGLMLAIDDFSMGQTSVHYLRENLFDEIKLDGALVQGLDSQQNCREIISSIVQLADSLSLTVVAEFVETKEQRETLHEIGCDCYQGYLYSPAVFLEN